MGWLKRIGFCVVGLLLVLMTALPGLAKTATNPLSVLEHETPLELERGTVVDPSEVPPVLDDPQAFEAFVDGVFEQQLAGNEVPGGVVALVKDGEIFFAKGYGYADLEQEVPVEADRTLFRVASLSKLFTMTAIMQLEEQGLLDLDDDVRDYLGDRIKLDNPFDTPVTFAQLLTHTDGSTKGRIGLAADTEARMQPLEDYLADHLPPIIYPPGELFSYSSHSVALLGYLVQQISGEPFVEYINNHILQPLKMSRSTFAQPPPPPLDEALARGYQRSGEQFQPVPYLFLNIGPAASLSATAIDMTHFMLAHLQGGRFGDAQILQPDTVETMHEVHFRPHPELPGTGYGFRERFVNGLRVIGHLGSLRGYSSSLTLMPDRDIGIFIATNSFSGIHSQLLSQFFDRYFPGGSTALPEQTIDRSTLDLDRFTGVYRDLEYPHHTLAKLTAPYQRIHIRRTETGLEIQPPGLFFRRQFEPIRLEPIAPLLFRHGDGNTLTAFEADAEGNILYAYNPIFEKMATFAKIAWYERVWLHAGIMGFAILMGLTALWVWPIHPWTRKLRHQSNPLAKSHPGAWRVAGITGLLNLLFLVGFPLSLWLYGAWKLVYGIPVFGLVFLVIPIITAVLAVVMVGYTIQLWTDSRLGWRSPVHYSLITLSAVGLTLSLWYWQVLGF